MITLSIVDNTLKQVYLEVLRNQININSDVVFGKIKQTNTDIWGKEVIKLAPYKNNKGEDVNLKEDLVNFYGTIEIADKAIRVSQNNSNAFVNLLNAECEELIKEAKNNIKDHLWNKDRFITRELPDGTIEKLPYKKMVGITEIFDITKDTIYGCKRAEVPQLNPIIKTVKEFTGMSIIEALDDMEQLGSNIDFIVCSYASKIKLQKNLIDINNVQLQGVPFVPVPYLEDDEIYLLNTGDFTFCQLCDWIWLEDDNGRILKQNAGKPTYNATLVKYGNLICDNISKQCLLKLKGESDD